MTERQSSAALADLVRAHLIHRSDADQWELHGLVQVFGRRMAVRDERSSDRADVVRRLADHYVSACATAVNATQPAAGADWYWMDRASLPHVEPDEAAQ